MKKSISLIAILSSFAIIISIISIIANLYLIPKTANDLFEDKLSPSNVDYLKILQYSDRKEITILGSKSAHLLIALENSIYNQKPILQDLLRNGNYSYSITINYINGKRQSFEIFAKDHAIHLDGKKYSTNILLNDIVSLYYD